MIALARLCVIVPFAYIFVYAAGAFLLPKFAAPYWIWGQRVVVSVGILCLLWIFVKHPLSSRRTAALTHTLIISFVLVLPAILTSYWPGVIGAFAAPLLVAGSAIWERGRGG